MVLSCLENRRLSTFDDVAEVLCRMRHTVKNLLSSGSSLETVQLAKDVVLKDVEVYPIERKMPTV